jgi:hypothetical protein
MARPEQEGGVADEGDAQLADGGAYEWLGGPAHGGEEGRDDEVGEEAEFLTADSVCGQVTLYGKEMRAGVGRVPVSHILDVGEYGWNGLQ